MNTKQRKCVEANAYDSFWGIGKGLRDPDLSNTVAWKGQNQLGQLLDNIREQFK